MSLNLLWLMCIFPTACLSQSYQGPFIDQRYKPIPINVDTKSTTKCARSTPIEFKTNFEFETLLFNTGQSVQTNDMKANAANVTGGLLGPSIYHYLTFTYYWIGENSAKFTGTTIDGKGFPYEVRVLYINTNYATIEEAVKQPDGLAEFVYVFKICSIINKQFGKLSKSIEKISHPGSFSVVTLGTQVAAINFIPQDFKYYTYLGSFRDNNGKTYQCSTVVIFKLNPKFCITQKQFKKAFGSLKNTDGDTLTNTLTQDPSSTTRRVHSCKNV